MLEWPRQMGGRKDEEKRFTRLSSTEEPRTHIIYQNEAGDYNASKLAGKVGMT